MLQAAAGVRYDDPAFAIEWPLPVSVISEKDRSWPDFLAIAYTASWGRNGQAVGRADIQAGPLR